MNTRRFRMLRLFLSLFVLVGIFGVTGATGGGSRSTASVAGDYVPGELLVKFRSGVAPAPARGAAGVDMGVASLNALAAQYGVTAVEPLFAGVSASSANLEQVYKLALAPTADVLAAAETLSLDPNVVYAEPNYVLRVSQAPEPVEGSQPQPVEPLPVQALDVQSLVAKANATGNIRIIVGLRAASLPATAELNTETETAYRASIAQAQRNLLTELSGYQVDNVVEIKFIPYMGMVVDASTLQRLAMLPEVMSIEEDIPMSLASTEAPLAPELSESTAIVGAKEAWKQGYTGAGWTVVVLDTGVDKTHPFLKGKVVSEACYSSQGTSGGATYRSLCHGSTDTNPITATTALDSAKPCPSGLAGLLGFGRCEHGTHVAGIVAGKNNDVSGIAPDATLIAVQVFSQLVQPQQVDLIVWYSSDVIRGLERVYELRSTYKIAAVNMSFGTYGQKRPNQNDCDIQANSESNPATTKSLKAAIDQLKEVGIPTIVASGNDGFSDGISYPACISSAISVGSTDDGSRSTERDSISYTFPNGGGSNSANFLSLVAPGQWIYSSVPSGKYDSFAGTSMAAPHVAGAWAILKQRAPNATVDQVLWALTSTGTPIKDARNQITKPRIQVDAAVKAVLGGLFIPDGPTVNFGLRPLGLTAVEAFSVNNTTVYTVEIVSTSVTHQPFSFLGGVYPGNGATCSTVIPAQAACTIAIAFAPTQTVPTSSQVQLVYRRQGDTQLFTTTLQMSGVGGGPPVNATDPLFLTQYGLNNTGQTGGVADADIDAPEAWGIGTGSTGTMIAVIDTGVYYTHDDLNDGRVRTDIDWDYVNNDNDALDDNGHGTHVAGIIAAETNNGFGTAGVMWQARILPLKVCNSRGSCNSDHIAQAIKYAANQGARVINMSLGGSCSSVIADAMNYAHFDKGAVVVAAAGNNGSGVNFPAKHDLAIAVGATDKSDKIASFSSRGDGLDVMAPGVSIMSTVPKNGHDTLSGTSMASPYVAGVAGLLLAQRPNLTNEQVRDILRGSADDLGTVGKDSTYGYGRANAFKALQMPAPSNPTASLRADCGCPAVTAARDSTDGLGLLSNLRTLRDQVFTQNPGQRWARIYYEHQFEVGWLVLSNAELRGDVLAGWREFDPVFRALIDPSAPSVTLTPELIAAARRVMVEGVAGNASSEVHDVIVEEWNRVNPDRFAGWDVRDVWEQLRKENGPKVHLPVVRH